jgi:hypothetical protein
MAYKDLFFIKRVPKISGVELYWKRPSNETDYQRLLDQEGFISPPFWKQNDLLGQPVIKQDLSDLEEHLLPAFWEINQRAKYYQNSFYYYQWVFMLGAFFTTVLGAATTLAYTLGGDAERYLTVGLGLMTMIISGALGAFATLNEQMSPQKRWANNRRLAEELRTTYFKYLAHLSPFDTPDRVQEMRRAVLQVRRKENENA